MYLFEECTLKETSEQAHKKIKWLNFRNNSTMERLHTLEGVLDRLVFASDTSDFTVARLVVKGRREPVTIVGYLPSPHPGTFKVIKGKFLMSYKDCEAIKSVYLGSQLRLWIRSTRCPRNW